MLACITEIKLFIYSVFTRMDCIYFWYFLSCSYPCIDLKYNIFYSSLSGWSKCADIFCIADGHLNFKLTYIEMMWFFFFFFDWILDKNNKPLITAEYRKYIFWLYSAQILEELVGYLLDERSLIEMWYLNLVYFLLFFCL